MTGKGHEKKIQIINNKNDGLSKAHAMQWA
jgi:hypothetical protein